MPGNCSEPLAIDKEQGFRFVSRLSSLTTFDSDKATRGRAARHIVNRKAVDAENFPAENFLRLISLRNVPAGWSHKSSAGHRDILGRILLHGAGVPFATLTFTQRRPTTPSLSLFAKFSPVIEVAKFFK